MSTIRLPPGLEIDAIKQVDVRAALPPARDEIYTICVQVAAKLRYVASGAAGQLPPEIQALDRDVFSAPADATFEWLQAASERLVLIEFGQKFVEWFAVTATGSISLPQQSAQFVADMLRQPTFEQKLTQLFLEKSSASKSAASPPTKHYPAQNRP